jgi:hypothetical protein
LLLLLMLVLLVPVLLLMLVLLVPVLLLMLVLLVLVLLLMLVLLVPVLLLMLVLLLGMNHKDNINLQHIIMILLTLQIITNLNLNNWPKKHS